jgi:hypothetical protein
MLVVCSLALAKTREVESFFSGGLLNDEDAHQIDSILASELEMQILLRLSLMSSSKFSPILTIDSSHQWKPGERLLDSKQLSCLRKRYSCSTIYTTNSTRNTITSTHSVHYILADDVYTNLEQISA